MCRMAADHVTDEADPEESKAASEDELSMEGKGPIALRDFMEHLHLASADAVMTPPPFWSWVP